MIQPHEPQEAKPTQHWMHAILLKYGHKIFDRCMHFYARLQQLPRRVRRQIQYAAGVSLASVALIFALSGTPTVEAATITVDGMTCTLADAITAANSNTMTGGCAAGDDAGGYDTIDLQAGVTLVGVLPQITSPIVINGNSNTIDGGGSPALDVRAGGDLTLNDTIIDNATTSVHLQGGSVEINRSQLTRVAFSGGNFGSAFTINESVLSGEVETFAFGYPTTVNDSTVRSIDAQAYVQVNRSEVVGGGVLVPFADIVFNYSTVRDNLTGKGINCLQGSVTLNHSTISGNVATGDDGGGIEADGCTVTLNDSTVTNNSADNGGGILVYGGGTGSSTLTLNRSIVSGNVATTSGDEIYQEANGMSFSTLNANNYNLIGHSGNNGIADNGNVAYLTTNVGGAGDIIAPAAVIGQILNTTAADNGGPTLTHALVLNSPAIDQIPDGVAGCDGQNGGSTSIDQRGAARAQGANQGDAACDIGAYEFASSQTPLAVQMAESGAEPAGLSAVAWLSALLLALSTAWVRLKRS